MGIRRFFNVIGCILAVLNSAFDLLYFVKSTFSSKTLYMVTIVAVLLRMAVNFGFCQYLFSKWVSNYRPGLSAIGEDKYREDDSRDKTLGGMEQQD